MRKKCDSGGEREISQEMQRGRADAHSGLSGHVFTLYKDIWAWHAATRRAAIHQSCGSPSQIHQESPLLLAELVNICLPTAFPICFFSFPHGEEGLFLVMFFPPLSLLGVLEPKNPLTEEERGLRRSQNEWLTLKQPKRNCLKNSFF